MTDPKTVPTELILIKGSVTPFEIYLVDATDQLESLSDVTKATLSVKSQISPAGDADLIMQRAVSLTNLAIDTVNKKITCTFTQSEANAFVPGTYIAELAIYIGGSTIWKHSERFYVRIEDAVAGHLQ